MVDCRENPTPWPPGTVIDEEAGLVTMEFENVVVVRPFEWVVCGLCRGRGKHVNPSIDADHGISPEEFANDPGFEEAYFSGVYDVDCAECRGRRVVPRLTGPCSKLDAYRRSEYEYRRLCDMERRMGA